MLDLINRDLTPNPFNPQPGDVYSRSHAGPDGHRHGDTIPRRIVVHDVISVNDEPLVRVTVDGAAMFSLKPMAMFREFLASIPGLEAIGRVRSEPESM